MDLTSIRNFSIIAHIDHGKSTLADRMIEATGTLEQREMREQVLDSMDLERERGITIKAQAVRISYKHTDGKTYQLNLIDTPGHVDFTYEVSRSLAACDGALLVVDAAQGVEAQTLANVYLALENDLEIVPILNKIDLPSSDIEGTKEQITEFVGLDAENALCVSAKTGEGFDELFASVIENVPPPEGKADAPLRALVFDSSYDDYRGVVAYVRVVDGSIKKGDKMRFMAGGTDHEVTDLGYFGPQPTKLAELATGEVGYVIGSIKEISCVRVGDTITSAHKPAAEPLPGYKPAKPMVFAGLYPVNAEDYDDLKDAIDKFRLNDASLFVEPETSNALGFGFRCGFLGLLHMEIVQERIEREFNVEILTVSPSVGYQVVLTTGETVEIDNPADLPDPGRIDQMQEPYIQARMMFPANYTGAVIKLCQDKQGEQQSLQYVTSSRVMLTYDLPLAEIILDFYDKLKSATQGYASFDYEITGYRQAKLDKLDILINGDPVDALSVIVRRENAYYRGRALAQKLRKLVPRQLYEVVIQAAIGKKVLARETIKALRKNVTAKCYGGDVTRKRKLLEKQKEGKKRMKQVGTVEIPQEAFMSVLRVDEK